MEIVAVDVGGTHARFAIAQLCGGVVTLGPETVLRTSDFSGLPEAWDAYRRQRGGQLPHDAGIAVAAALDGDAVRLTNNKWVIQRSALAGELELDRFTLLNDFGAVAHAVATCAQSELRHLCGPSLPLPAKGIISIVGPGTGLGVAILHRGNDGDCAIETEGGHVGFSPVDEVDDRIMSRLRERFGRVSIERIVSGAGLTEIHAVMSGSEAEDDRALWQRAMSGEDPVAAASLDRFCAILGSVAGDFALGHGAHAVVIAGGLGLRLARHLPGSAFAARFVDKGRYRSRMGALPVKLVTHPQPGLLGAAAAFAAENT